MKACWSSDISFWWQSAIPKSSGADAGHTSSNLKFGMATCEILTRLLPIAGRQKLISAKSEGPESESNDMCKIGLSRDAIATFRSGWHQGLSRSNRLRVVVEGLCKNYGKNCFCWMRFPYRNRFVLILQAVYKQRSTLLGCGRFFKAPMTRFLDDGE
jgi:hypothetical protein